MKRKLKQSMGLLLLVSLLLLTSACGGKSASKGNEKEAEGTKNTFTIAVKKDFQTVNFEDMQFWKDMEEKTGVHFEFIQLDSEALEEKRNLLIAGGDLPDAFWGCGFSTTDLARYGADGTFVELQGYIDESCPNVKAIYDREPGLRAAMTFGEDKIYSFPSIFDNESPNFAMYNLFWVNSKWLDRCGLENPTTIEGFYHMLKAFKEMDANGNGDPNDEIPLGIVTYADEALSSMTSRLSDTWGVCNHGTRQNVAEDENGDLYYTMTHEGWYNAIDFMNRLYEEGLLEPQCATMEIQDGIVKASSDQYGVVLCTAEESFQSYTGDWVALNVLHDETDPDKAIYATAMTGIARPGSFVITSACSQPEVLCQWVDYLYSEEGTALLFLGREGEQYYIDEEGLPQFYDYITKDPEKTTFEKWGEFSPTVSGGAPGVVTSKYYIGAENAPNTILAGELYEPFMPAFEDRWPAFTFTIEEAETLAQLSDIDTYANSTTIKFILGTEDLETGWDGYVRQIENMGIEEYLKVYTSARDRYLETLGALERNH